METNDRHYLVIEVAVRTVTMDGLPWLEQGNFVLQAQALAALMKAPQTMRLLDSSPQHV